MGESRSFLIRAAALAGCAALLWVAGLAAGARAADLRGRAASAGEQAQRTVELARQLAAAQARGGASVQRMPRA